jgi:hypothetical protein
MIEFYTIADRSIVRCSVTQQILAIFRQPSLFFGLLSLRQGKESNKQPVGQNNSKLGGVMTQCFGHRYCHFQSAFLEQKLLLG